MIKLFDDYKNAVINEIKRYLCVLSVEENIDDYYFEENTITIHLPCDFHYKMKYEYIDWLMHTDYTIQQVGYRVVNEIRNSFLDCLLNKKS
jgi:hypothetical protein